MKRIREINKELDLLLKRVVKSRNINFFFEMKVKVKTYSEIIDFFNLIAHIDTSKKPKFFMEDFYKSHNKVFNGDSFLGEEVDFFGIVSTELEITIEEVILYILKNSCL